MPNLHEGRNGSNRNIMLTFDDGPSLGTTPALLEILARCQIKALFFTVGKKLATRDGSAIAKQAGSEGHVLGNHSYSHQNLCEFSRDKVQDELKRTHDLICEYAGECKYFRPPFGRSNSIVAEIVQELGYTTLLWNVDSLDWKLKQNGQWIDHAMDQINTRETSIVLMHDIHRTTVENLESLIRRIKRIPNSRFVLY